MTARPMHSLADARHAERYAATATVCRPERRRPLRGARRRLGVLLVEAGLHLLISAEPPRVPGPARFASPAR